MSGEGNLALVGKSKHSTASKSQLCFAHIPGVFSLICARIWAILDGCMWKWKAGRAVVGLWADCTPVLAATACGKVPYRHMKSLWCEGGRWIWGLDLSQLTRDPALGNISPIMQAVLFPLLSHFCLMYWFVKSLHFLRLSWEPSTQKSQGHPLNDVFTLAAHCKHSQPPVCSSRGQGQAAQQRACLEMMDGKEQAWRGTRASGTKQLHWAAIIIILSP